MTRLMRVVVTLLLAGMVAWPALGALVTPTVNAAGAAVEGAPSAATPPPARVRAPLPALTLQAAQIATATPTNEQRLAALHQMLDTAWNAQNWPEALRIISDIMAIDPNYDNVRERQYFAYVNYGLWLMNAGRCAEAMSAFMSALQVRPNGQEALAGLQLAARYCPTPTPTGGTISPTVTVTPIQATPTPTTQVISGPVTYTVQAGDTLNKIARQFSTSVQAIMQANGLMTYFIRAGDVLIIPGSGTPPPGMVVYIVQPGDTLDKIARQYHTTSWAIMAANNLTSYALYAYRAIYIPTVLQPGPIIHIVMPGETLNSIATLRNVTVPNLMMANNLTGYSLYVYQRLIIPPTGWNGWPPLVPGMGSGATIGQGPRT
jgi:LysM repeat protein